MRSSGIRTFKKEIPSITSRMFSKELRELKANGIVSRAVQNTISVRIEYSLSDLAKDLGTILVQMLEWGGIEKSNWVNFD